MHSTGLASLTKQSRSEACRKRRSPTPRSAAYAFVFRRNRSEAKKSPNKTPAQSTIGISTCIRSQGTFSPAYE